jgi:predicted RNase H-like nuclease (RuvC/YqgF family)
MTWERYVIPALIAVVGTLLCQVLSAYLSKKKIFTDDNSGLRKDLMKERTDLVKEISDLAKRCSDLEDQNTEFREEIIGLKEKNAELERKNNELQSEIDCIKKATHHDPHACDNP